MNWEIDPNHTRIEFSVRQWVMKNVKGRIGVTGGTIDLNEEDPTHFLSRGGEEHH